MPQTILLLCCMLFFPRCSNAQQPVKVPVQFDWQGHRGCRGLMPENTVPAFLHALEYPALETLELDLAVSRDGQLIVSHEPWFNPDICTAPGGGIITHPEENYLIYHFTAEEIRGFDCGSLPNPRFPQQKKLPAYKPTLAEVVAAVYQADTAGFKTLYWNIEIKSRPEWDGVKTPPVDSFARLVVETVTQLGIAERTTVQSFDVRALQEVRKIQPSLSLALLVENARGVQYNLRKLGFVPEIYSPYHVLVSSRTVRKCRAKNMKLIPWTVNDVKTMRSLILMGVDGIITDYPNLIEQVVP